MKTSESKIRVLHMASGLSTEGIGSFIMNTYENINDKNFELNIALATKWEQKFEYKVINKGDKVYRTYEIGDGLLGKVKHFFNLIRLLNKEGPFDVVHSHMDFFNGINVFAAFIARVPIRISHAHKAAVSEKVTLSKKLYVFIMKILISLFSTNKLGCSKMANEYMHGMKWKKSRNYILFNGINLERFSGKSNNLSIKKEINLDENKINFVTIGRIDSPKNPLFIVKVLNELKRINPKVHLYWIGEGSLKNDIENVVNEKELNDTITLLGVREDVADILSEMDFMLFPSLWEGLPIVVIEAQASGVPCFISDTITNEVNAGLCTVLSLKEDEKEWASKINSYILSEEYCNKVDEKIIKKFDIRNIVKELEELYLCARS